MGHEPAEMIEHVQHDAHHAHDGFDKLVAISVAILAAGLAYVTILSHQMHNDVVMKQLEAGLSKNEATNRWGQYGVTNNRFHNYRTAIDLSESESTPNSEKRKALVEDYRKKVDSYESKDGKTGKLPEIKKLAEAAEQLTIDKMAASVHSHHKAEQIDLGELGLAVRRGPRLACDSHQTAILLVRRHRLRPRRLPLGNGRLSRVLPGWRGPRQPSDN